MTDPRILDIAFDVREFPPLVLLILIRMARLGNRTGQVFASQETIAVACNCSVRSVRRAMEVLRDRGYITRIPRLKLKTDRYVLNYHRWKVSSGQLGRRDRSAWPLRKGQTGRQNPNPNPKLNRQSGRGRHIGNALDEVLGNMARLLDRENGIDVD